MDDAPEALPNVRESGSAFEQELRAMNEALLVSSVRQHELADQAQKADALSRASEESLRQIHAELLVHMEELVQSRQAMETLNSKLQVSEIRYRRLFESSKEGTLILDADRGTIIDANSFMSDLLGYSHAEYLGKELWEIGFFKDKWSSEAAMRELQATGFIRYEHLPLETKRSESIEVEVVASAYQADKQNFIQFNIRDITERRRLERTTREQAEALADLHRRKDEFLAMLSHELRNPLAPILNGVQLLGLRKNSDPIQQQAMGIIVRQVGQLKRLIDDLMEVSRINTGRIHLHLELVALGGIVESAVETVRPLIDQRRHVLNVSLPLQPIWIHADAARVEQVVVNLLTNAAKYTGEGGQVWLSIAQEGDEAVLRTRDTGIGIAPELLPRIFDLFTQSERSLDRSQGGLGIGLSLVQRIVEMHQGVVAVYSVLGHGSEFIVRLPVVATTTETLPSSPVTVIAQLKTCLRLLVVDDNVDAAHSLAMVLKEAGHDVGIAHDGPSALVVALEHCPDVVLLDIGLPGMDGYEVAKRLRHQFGHKNVVLVAVTGYGQKADRQQSLEAGFDYHLVKPADIGELRQILAAVSKKMIGSSPVAGDSLASSA